MTQEALEFAQRLNREIKDRVELSLAEDGVPYSESAFTEYILDQLETAGVIMEARACYFEGTLSRGIVKINGFGVDEEQGLLCLVTTIYTDDPQAAQLGRDEVVRAAERCVRFFEDACNGYYTRMEPAGDAYDVAARIKSLTQEIDRLKIYVLTDGTFSGKPLPERETLGTKVQHEVWDIHRLFRTIESEQPRTEIQVDFTKINGGPIPCLPMPEVDPDYCGYMAVIPGIVLYHLYEDYGSRLLELNVRSFLGIRGSKTVNSGIRRTLKEESRNFMAYNNGIVVTADRLDLIDIPGGGKAIRSMTGLQIVNGGQTTASIHRAKKIDKVDISSVFVPAKIAVIKKEKLDLMVERISHFANSQNTVQPADFSSNEPFHVQLEQLSNNVWCPDGKGRWFYERARGSYQVALAKVEESVIRARQFKEQTPSHRRFTKPELAKYVNAWDQKPYWVAYGSQKNFDHFMQDLRKGRGPEWSPDATYFRELVAKVILFRTAIKIINQEKFPAHKANIAAYLVAKLSWESSRHLQLEHVWKAQVISPALCELLRLWSHEIDQTLRSTASGKMVTEWAKKSECWEHVKDAKLALPDPLPVEMLGSRTGGTEASPADLSTIRVSPEDYRFMQACKAIDGPTWLKISGWGKKSGELQKWQWGIAHTLAGYAASDWEKEPSIKQARHGTTIIEIATKAGVLS
jgi:hypothetical protein